MGHSVTKHWWIDLLDIVLSQIKDLEKNKSGERIRGKFVDRVPAETKYLQWILQSSPIVRSNNWYLIAYTQTQPRLK